MTWESDFWARVREQDEARFGQDDGSGKWPLPAAQQDGEDAGIAVDTTSTKE
jgi:hypothetical protein